MKINPAKILILVAFPCLLTSCNREHTSRLPDLKECGAGFTGPAFDFLTWNVHEFPSGGTESIDHVAALILNIDADVVALQEITGSDDFGQLLNRLPGYRGLIDGGSDLNLAYLFKKNLIPVSGETEILFEDDPYLFPRPPIRVSVVSPDGLKFILINLHLKCCEGKENEYRRKMALEKLKSYIGQNLARDRVIVAGDFNEALVPGDSGNIFSLFSADSLNYRFADLSIAGGDPSDWSYPDWPSHLDHFLITNELFENHLTVTTLKPDECDSLYFECVSDHRPVLLSVY